jgi:hypothetical protein
MLIGGYNPILKSDAALRTPNPFQRYFSLFDFLNNKKKPKAGFRCVIRHA